MKCWGEYLGVKIIGECGKLHDEGLYNLHSSPCVLSVAIWRMITWVVRVERLE